MQTLEREHFDRLVEELQSRGYEVIGPRVAQGAIGLEPVSSAADLPVGLRDEQDGGTYRLVDRGDQALFGFATTPQSWKRLLHPPVLKMWSASRDPATGAITVADEDEPVPRRAFLGVRSCDLHAIRALDQALLEVEHPDQGYAARRAELFVVALNCSTPGGTCFCVSMQTGPRASFGYDIALTEVIEDDRHYFVCEAASEHGEQVLAALPTRGAADEELIAADGVVERTAAGMGRELDTDGIKELLDRNLEHPRWDEVSERCLSCGNCTSVCPTCFCTDVDDVTDLAAESAEHWRRWDSCFNLDFSYIHGGSVRSSTRARYRQWMTHKLSTWFDQFGSSGCVGCGRCVTWCPVAIDITEEAAAIRATDGELR